MQNSTSNTEKTAKNSTPGAVAVNRKKITVDTRKTSGMEVGENFTGIYLQQSEKPWLDRSTGEEKMIPQFLFEEKLTKERFLILGDAGFKNAFNGAGVKEGTWVEVVKLEQVDIGGGKRVNQYDIFELSN